MKPLEIFIGKPTCKHNQTYFLKVLSLFLLSGFYNRNIGAHMEPV
jgi:hypothetical protein